MADIPFGTIKLMFCPDCCVLQQDDEGNTLPGSLRSHILGDDDEWYCTCSPYRAAIEAFCASHEAVVPTASAHEGWQVMWAEDEEGGRGWTSFIYTTLNEALERLKALAVMGWGCIHLIHKTSDTWCMEHNRQKDARIAPGAGDPMGEFICPECEKEATALDKCYVCGTALTECPDMKGFMECLACKPKTKVFLMVDATVLLEFPNMDTAEAWLNEQPDPVIFSTQLGLSAEEVKQGKVGDLAIPKVALHFDTWEWNTPDGKCPF